MRDEGGAVDLVLEQIKGQGMQGIVNPFLKLRQRFSFADSLPLQPAPKKISCGRIDFRFIFQITEIDFPELRKQTIQFSFPII